MAEYITKEAAIQTFEWGEADVIEDNGDGYNFGFSRGSIKSAINAIPAADVAPVVRCKDCKHYDMGVCLKIYSDGNVHPEAWQERKPEDFCSYGERKDGGERNG